MAVTAESVVVELEAKFDRFEAEVRGAAGTVEAQMSRIGQSAIGAENALGKVSSGLGTLRGAAVGFASVVTVDKIIQLTSAALDYAASIGETSQQLGVSTKAYQELSYAATQTGIDQATLEAGLAKLTKTLGEAKTGSDKQVAAFDAIGVSAKDLQRLSPDEAFRKIADALSKIEDPATRAALEVEFFGKSGQKLDTLLAGGVGQIDELARAAGELGIVLSDQQLQKADETADKLAAIKTVLSANIAGVVADNADSILSLANALVTLAGAAGRGLGAVKDYFVGLEQINKDTRGQGFKGLVTRFNAADNPEIAIERGRQSRQFQAMSGLGNLGANGLPGFDRPASPFTATPVDTKAAAKAERAAATGAAKAERDAAAAARKAEQEAERRRAVDLDRVRLFGTKSDPVANVKEGIVAASDDAKRALAEIDGSAKTLGETLEQAFSTANLDDLTIKLPNLSAQLDAAVAIGDRFAEDLSRNLGQAIVNGQSLGDALVNSIKAASAQLITSGLLKLLGGDSAGGGGLFTSIAKGLGSIFGGTRASGGPVNGGKLYLTNEGSGPGELFMPGKDGHIFPAGQGRSGAGITVVQNLNVSLAGNAATREDAITFATIARDQAIAAFQSTRNFGVPSV